MPTTFAGIEELRDAVGQQLGPTEWLEVTQERIDGFADATGDHQWIHTDPERAAAGPFGATIAHGYLTLALTNKFLPELLTVEGIAMGVNYGTDKVRFPAPVVVGSNIRAKADIRAVDDIPGGVQAVIVVTVEIDGGDKPACVVESVSRFIA